MMTIDNAKTQKQVFSISDVLNDPVKKTRLLGIIEEIVLHDNTIKQEKEAIKDIQEVAKDELGIPSSVLNQLVAERIDNGAILEKNSKLEEIQNLAESLGISTDLDYYMKMVNLIDHFYFIKNN